MLKELLKRLGRILNEEKISYMIIGGQAVLLYGEPRFTRDIDITVSLSPQEWKKVLRVAEKCRLRPLVENPEDFVKKTMVLPCLDEETSFRVDFIFSTSPYEKEAMKRRRKIEMDEIPVYFISPEDLVVFKLVAGRPRDIEDVEGILAKTEVDESYIKKKLRMFDKALPLFEKILLKSKEKSV